MKITEKKRLVLIGIRRKGEHGFKIKIAATDETLRKENQPLAQSCPSPLA